MCKFFLKTSYFNFPQKKGVFLQCHSDLFALKMWLVIIQAISTNLRAHYVVANFLLTGYKVVIALEQRNMIREYMYVYVYVKRDTPDCTFHSQISSLTATANNSKFVMNSIQPGVPASVKQ